MLGFIGITDETALLFVVVARLRGKCTWAGRDPCSVTARA